MAWAIRQQRPILWGHRARMAIQVQTARPGLTARMVDITSRKYRSQKVILCRLLFDAIKFGMTSVQTRQIVLPKGGPRARRRTGQLDRLATRGPRAPKGTPAPKGQKATRATPASLVPKARQDPAMLHQSMARLVPLRYRRPAMVPAPLRGAVQ